MLYDAIDPFHGSGSIDLPEPEGIAATWPFLKAQTGNTHPGACLPFGMVSVAPYSGAYPTGYGLNDFNYHGTVPRRFEHYTATGFTHCRQSGTGAIGEYYNFARVFPFRGRMNGVSDRWHLTDEEARPGRYAATLGGIDVRAEVAAAPGGAHHRYTFPGDSAGGVGVDVGAHGILGERRKTAAMTAHTVELRDDDTVAATVVVSGIAVHVCVALAHGAALGGPTGTGSRAAEAPGATLWVDGSATGARSLTGGGEGSFGVAYEWADRSVRSVEVTVALSFRSVDHAAERLARMRRRRFDDVAATAERIWRGYTDAVDVETDDEALRSVFASCLYHSLIKPCDLSGESPFWRDSEPCFVDCATMWDQYKTQLPLVLTLYPQTGAGIVNSLIRYGEEAGRFPIGVLLCDSLDRFREQARSLACYTIADAWYRQLPGVDFARAALAMAADLDHPENAAFDAGAALPRATHGLDLAGAAFAAARVAAGAGRRLPKSERDRIDARMKKRAGLWRRFYDETTGLLVESEYYEGTKWNYSFRLLHDMQGRIELAGGSEAFVALLDRFFGYGAEPVVRAFDPADDTTRAALYDCHRFCGYNNEPDIEAPYAYLWAGRHDRTAQVVRSVLRHNFTVGRGGLPGNDDSGGLSSAFVWNALGLFPVTGQPIVLIGSPCFREASLSVGEGTLTIAAPGAGDGAIYVRAATLNGVPLNRAWLTVDEITAGGELTFDMSATPTDFGAEVPPSYP